MKLTSLLVLMTALAFALAACGGDDEEEGGGAAGGGAPKKSVTVVEKDIQFKPKSVTVAKGGTVTWVNEDSAPHDVTKEGGPGPDFSSGKGDMKKGDRYKRSFNAAGAIKYVCTVHPGMTGEVVVK